MATIAIVGDGPGGLSAALFLAKTGHDVRVFGMDETAMHYANVNNYLGIAQIHGSEFQDAAKDQVVDLGATLVKATVASVAAGDDGFAVVTDDETNPFVADYLVLSEGRKAPLAESLGVAMQDDHVVVDRDGRTSIERVYVVGRSARPNRSQAIISAGDGAAAALDILADIEGKDVQDWDS
ncbi:MAG: FAD-dependent oxidoreductase [Actinomycetota bacterium]